MLRKLILALAAGAALTALTPLAASAHWYGGWGHHSFYRGPVIAPTVRVFSSPSYAGYGPCLRQRWIATPYGMRLRWVNMCAY